MTILTSTMIDHLIGARNRITDRRDELIDFRAVDHIDAVLSEVPAGDRPDVDALLGRTREIDQSAARWSTDEQRAAWKAEAEQTGAQLAAAKMAEYAKWQENAKDWNDIKGDCAL